MASTWLYGIHTTQAEIAAVLCGTNHAATNGAVSTPLQWIFKTCCVKLQSLIWSLAARTQWVWSEAENNAILERSVRKYRPGCLYEPSGSGRNVRMFSHWKKSLAVEKVAHVYFHVWGVLSMKHFTISMPVKFIFPHFFSWCTFLYVDAHCISLHVCFLFFFFVVAIFPRVVVAFCCQQTIQLLCLWGWVGVYHTDFFLWSHIHRSVCKCQAELVGVEIGCLMLHLVAWDCI